MTSIQRSCPWLGSADFTNGLNEQADRWANWPSAQAAPRNVNRIKSDVCLCKGNHAAFVELLAIKSDHLADGGAVLGREHGLTMPVINKSRELERHERSDSNPQLRPEVPHTEQQESSEPLPVGSGIFATTTLVGISVIAAELLVIATPSIGFIATFAFLVLGALLAACMLATAMERIFGREE